MVSMKKLNLKNQTFGKLSVIDEAPKRPNEPHSYWKCKCECGNITEVRGFHLRNGNIKSCGCFKNPSKNDSHNWNGYEEISLTYFNSIKKRAKKDDIFFNLLIQDLWNQFIKQNRRCSLTGLILTFNSKTHLSDGTASLDRIDSTKGYTVDNIQWIHKDVNRMKSDLNESKFVELCGMVSNYKKI